VPQHSSNAGLTELLDNFICCLPLFDNHSCLVTEELPDQLSLFSTALLGLFPKISPHNALLSDLVKQS